MEAKTTRILMEARPLLWPWCAVALAGALPLVYPCDVRALIILIGFLAIPLMATLSLGDEFQHRTLSLLLSQPIGRMRIWAEKISVTVVAILSAILVFSLALRATSFHPGRQESAFAGAWIVAITASATFWTLFTRSSVGGVALNIGVQSFISFAVPWTKLADGLRARGYLAPGSLLVPSTVTFAFLCYAGVMLWLGARMLARFQATGGIASDDLLMAGPDVTSGALAGWLRCRPKGALLNLFRKELRLLRPVWLIILLAGVGWSCLTLFGLLFERGFSRNFETAVVIVGVVSTLMIAILAGSLPLGEEKTPGTHAWNLTLPVPALLQWRVKLCIALWAGFVGGWLLPLLIARRFLYGPSRIFVDVHFGIGWLVGVLVLTFAAFWCACAVDGTVAAVLWVTPVTMVLGGASYFARLLGDGLVVSSWGPTPFENGSDWLLMNLAQRRNPLLNLLGNLRFDWWVARVSFSDHWWLSPLENSASYAALVGGPALILAVVQSYRLFRAQNRGDSRSVMRNLLPLALLVFLCGFSLAAFDAFWWRAGSQVFFFNSAIGNAIVKTLPDAAKLHPTEPLKLTVDDVAKAWFWPLENSTRHWLSGARITVTPDKAHPGGFFCPLDPRGHTSCYFSATIHLADGTDIIQSYDPSADGKVLWGCSSIYVRWPGATGQELLWDR